MCNHQVRFSGYHGDFKELAVFKCVHCGESHLFEYAAWLDDGMDEARYACAIRAAKAFNVDLVIWDFQRFEFSRV